MKLNLLFSYREFSIVSRKQFLMRISRERVSLEYLIISVCAIIISSICCVSSMEPDGSYINLLLGPEGIDLFPSVC